jgi:hypothetical protein
MRRKVVAGITLLGIAAVADVIWVKTRSHAPASLSEAMGGGSGDAVEVPAVIDPSRGSGSGSCGAHDQPAMSSAAARYALTRNNATCR